eukprot:TRINITY_DN8780_c0_g1_i1.p1 TRINITY_DN8780_c0_g1~~TRINITY_DN8780_c0_g1_i1.p1  ORF type:complete len:226 (-),score=111.78 TRINITY_DN8780_c0_g1_i1:127-804(-)
MFKNFNSLILLSLSLLICINFSESTIGVDISLFECDSISKNDWDCLISNGFTFAIIEAWNGGYQLTPEIARCVSDAWTAGMHHVDVYVFMCPNCVGNNPPAQAVNTILKSLAQQNVTYGMLWFDVEQCSGCWNDYASNVAFLQQAVNAAVQAGANVGIYSSEYEWSETVGDSTAFKQYPLWYAHWDQNKNFNDAWAYTFGGWTKPAIKQYDDKAPCVSADSNYYP